MSRWQRCKWWMTEDRRCCRAVPLPQEICPQHAPTNLPSVAWEPPWGWGRKLSAMEIEILEEMERLGVPATMLETHGTPLPPDADGQPSSDFPRLGKRP